MGRTQKYRNTSAKHVHPLPPDPLLALPQKMTFSVQEAADILGISTDSVTRYCKRGKLFAKPVQYGNKITFSIPRQAIQIFLHELGEQKVMAEGRSKLRNLPQPAEAHAGFQARFYKALETGTFNGKVYSPRTVEDYRHYLGVYFSRHSLVSADGLEAELGEIDPKRKATKVHYYKAVLCFTRYLASKGLVPSETIESIRRLKPQDNKNPIRHVITLSELERVEAACKSDEEHFLLRLLVSTGVRVSEACSLNWGQVAFERAELVNLEGKGGKVRDVAIPPKAMAVIAAFYQSQGEPSADQPLLINRDGNRMTPRGVHDRLERMGNRVGVKVHPHALRRAYVTINANQGVPLKALQESCGHSDLKTTSDYCRTSKEEALAIMKQVSW